MTTQALGEYIHAVRYHYKPYVFHFGWQRPKRSLHPASDAERCLRLGHPLMLVSKSAKAWLMYAKDNTAKIYIMLFERATYELDQALYFREQTS